MDDLGRPSGRRQASSSRRSSTHRYKPRARASNQSLQSAGRPQENTTFTSFEPFSPPNNLLSAGSYSSNGLSNGSGPRGRDDASIRSYSSSKRSRSIYAPDSQNSIVTEDVRGEGAAESGGDTETEADAASGEEQETRLADPVSAASHSLITVLNMAPRDDRPPLFADTNNPLNNPQVLQNADDKVIATYVKRQGGAAKVMRRLAKDVADRDAEISGLRKRLEEFGILFKDHMMTTHNMSRLDADRSVRALSPLTTEGSGDKIKDELEDAAADNPFADSYAVLSNADSHSINSTSALITSSTPATPNGSNASNTPRVVRNASNAKLNPINPPKQRGFFSMFGGGGSVRQPSKQNRNSIASMLDPRALNIRSPTIGTSRSNSMSSYKPLEMEQKIENECLPPPLLDMKVIKIIFRAFIADNYGFIIDAPRVVQWLVATKSIAMKQGASRGTSITTRASSIASAEDHGQEYAILDRDEDQEDANPESHDESRPWHEYLTLEVTKQALLSRLPIQLQGQKSSDRSSISSDTGSDLPRLEEVMDPADFTTHAEQLRDEISYEYAQLQIERDQAYNRLLSKIEEPKTQTGAGNRLSRIFTNNTEAVAAKNRAESMVSTGTLGIANLAKSSVSGPFMRFVLDGIPMKTRAKIWLESAQSSIHYSPSDFLTLQSEFLSTPENQYYLHDIQMDAPRTLTNNVYFRKEKNQDALSTLLGCFALRNKDVGYCQGFNIIAGYLLLAMPTTEQAFWVFCYLIEEILPKAYFTTSHDWAGPRADTIVLRQYIRSLLPRLSAHFDDLEISDEQTVPINWFLTAFASTLSVEALFRVWDVVLGIPGQSCFLLHVAIALLKLNEEELIKLGDAARVYDYLDRRMMGGVVTIDGLVQASSRLGGIVTAKGVERRRLEALKSLA